MNIDRGVFHSKAVRKGEGGGGGEGFALNLIFVRKWDRERYRLPGCTPSVVPRKSGGEGRGSPHGSGFPHIRGSFRSEETDFAQEISWPAAGLSQNENAPVSARD